MPNEILDVTQKIPKVRFTSPRPKQIQKLLPKVAKLTFRNANLATVGNPGPKINEKASNVKNKQLPACTVPAADPPPSARSPGVFSLFDYFLTDLGARITQSREISAPETILATQSTVRLGGYRGVHRQPD